jgi:hypothetical protein
MEEGIIMGFRRDGGAEHAERKSWEAWLAANADLLPACGLPPGVLRNRRDWEYLLSNGYWCADYYGSHIGNIDFDLNELDPHQRNAFRRLLERYLSAEEKSAG